MPLNIFNLVNDPFASFGTGATGVNDTDQIVGSYQDASFGIHGFLESGGTYTTLDDPLSPGNSDTIARGINDAGQIVGDYLGVDATGVSTINGFLLSNGTYTTINVPFPTAIGTLAFGINNLDHIAGEYVVDLNNTTKAFFYKDGSFFNLPLPSDTRISAAYGINDFDWIVGSYEDSNLKTHGFLFIAGALITLDDPLGTATVATGINDLNQIVGTFYTPDGSLHAFLWFGGTFTTIDDPVNGTTRPSGINNNSQMVGTLSDGTGSHGFLETTVPNPPPPAGTTADMILRGAFDPLIAGQYEIYDIGNNKILAGYSLGQVGTNWQFVGLGGFNGTDTTDMLLRNFDTGGFEVYDISNNSITNTASLGTVGMEWQVAGFGNFSSRGTSDMVLRNSTGGLEVYDIANNQIGNTGFMGTVGMEWQVVGVGDFSSNPGETDIMMRNTNTGGFEVYDVTNNQIINENFMGTVGLEWQVQGFGNFSGNPGETDMMVRNSIPGTNTGQFAIFDISNNQFTSFSYSVWADLSWQVAGFVPVSGAGRSDMVLRNIGPDVVDSGGFEVFDISNNQVTNATLNGFEEYDGTFMGTVGGAWLVGGLAADPPTGSMGSSGSTTQLVQAMAGFGGSSGASESLSTAALSPPDTSQQPLLTTPQHA